MSLWLTLLFNGLSLSSILLLIALGLAFSFGLMKVINMAHGELIMAGAYVTYMLSALFGRWFGPAGAASYFLPALVVSFVVTALLGLLLEATLIRFLYGRPLDTLLATWGVGLVLQQAARDIFGAPNVQVTSPPWLSGGLALAPGLLLPYKRLFIIGLVGVCVGGIYLYLYRSVSGRRIRAVSLSPPWPTPPRNSGLNSPPSLGRTEKKSKAPFWTPNFCPNTSKPEELLAGGNKEY